MHSHYVTVQEAATLLGVTETTVRIAILEDRLPHSFQYGRKLIAYSDLEIYRKRTQPNGVKSIGRPPKASNVIAE
jgi:excisionase family DNA binding protein